MLSFLALFCLRSKRGPTCIMVRNVPHPISMQFVSIKYLNPLVPIAHKSAQIDKISILKLEGIIKKISYERRDYESVDEKSLSKAMSRKTTKKIIQALKG